MEPPFCIVVLLLSVCVAFGAFAAVAVAVTEVRADAGDGGVVGAVEYYGHVVVALVVVELLYVGEHVAFEQAAAYYEECEVYVAVDDFCIGNNFYRWAVEQYVVVFFAELVEHGFQARFGGMAPTVITS